MPFILSQPIQALEHASFHKMIGIVARTSKGVTIPNCRAARDEVINMFKTQMTHLKNRFKGALSMQCAC
jgi:hypothetical protein